jgi:hypothetical protein
VDDWLAPFRDLWGPSLDALEQHLDLMDGSRTPEKPGERSSST